VIRCLQIDLPVENTQLYKDRNGGRVGHMGNQQKGEGRQGSVEMVKQVAGQSRYRIVSQGSEVRLLNEH
jgi:hypothetical protein